MGEDEELMVDDDWSDADDWSDDEEIEELDDSEEDFDSDDFESDELDGSEEDFDSEDSDEDDFDSDDDFDEWSDEEVENSDGSSEEDEFLEDGFDDSSSEDEFSEDDFDDSFSEDSFDDSDSEESSDFVEEVEEVVEEVVEDLKDAVHNVLHHSHQDASNSLRTYIEDSYSDEAMAEAAEEKANEDKFQTLLNLTSDAYTREFKRINIRQIGFTDPIKKGRSETMTGLTQSIKDFGVLDPIDVMTVEDPDDDFKYILLSGLRRVFGALKNGQTEIDAIVWDFKDKEQGSDLALYLGLLLNRTQKRNWGEIWHLYQILELQSSITPGTLEYLLQMESGDAMKLKDVMLCTYDEVKEALLSGDKTLDAAYKMLAKLRKEEDRLAIEDTMGAEDAVDRAEEIATDNTGESGQLSDQDVMELLEMVDSMDEDVTEEDFNDLNSGYDERQTVGDRHPLDPALKSAVLSRDNFRCKCCGFGGAAALGVLAVHHLIPVHTSGRDTLENLTTLCLNHHILLHVAERNGGKLQMTKEDFDSYSEEEQTALKKCLKLAKIAVEADKRKNMSLEDVRKATTDSIRHPMPGAGLKETQAAYVASETDKK